MCVHSVSAPVGSKVFTEFFISAPAIYGKCISTFRLFKLDALYLSNTQAQEQIAELTVIIASSHKTNNSQSTIDKDFPLLGKEDS